MLALLLTACAAFGAVDQYVGSLSRFWAPAWQVSALSAPWLLLPFLVGRTQRRPLRAAVLGWGGTLAALLAYGAMTVSPIEHASFNARTYAAFLVSNLLWFAGAAITGPLFGWLGHRWRTARAPYAAVVTSAVLVLEPFADHLVAVRSIPFGLVTTAETAAGVLLAALFGWQLVRSRRAGDVPA